MKSQRSKNATVVKAIESDEIVANVPEFFAQLLAPIMRFGEIAINQCSIHGRAMKCPHVYMGAWRKNWKTLLFTKSIAAKRWSKILGQPSETLLYISGLYILSINIQISFFPRKDLYPGGLISEGAFNRKDLYVSNLTSLYPGGTITGRAYTGVLWFIIIFG